MKRKTFLIFFFFGAQLLSEKESVKGRRKKKKKSTLLVADSFSCDRESGGGLLMGLEEREGETLASAGVTTERDRFCLSLPSRRISAIQEN
jgi:hypothetical protein